ncbi:hypothetical protein SAMN05421639_101490 [Chryseobacterium shigense]|uniref:Bacteriocin-type signal sequence-containing protein n=1 Tax=Chryseobacterium shigense TaxID=297244 RepID=A0A1N7HXC0_9FLAO|nr:hypothetical protein SAMN05421639_101490 [Chryseobacterium shigense]
MRSCSYFLYLSSNQQYDIIMKNQTLEKGKKLNKRALRSITGGLMMCLDPKTNQCRVFSKGCADPQCRPSLLD